MAKGDINIKLTIPMNVQPTITIASTIKTPFLITL